MALSSVMIRSASQAAAAVCILRQTKHSLKLRGESIEFSCQFGHFHFLPLSLPPRLAGRGN